MEKIISTGTPLRNNSSKTPLPAAGTAYSKTNIFPDPGQDAEKISVVLDEGARIPTRAHAWDAGYDLYAPENMDTIVIWKGDSAVIDTGVHIAIPEGYVGMLKSKSGLNVNHGIVGEGVIDSGYTGSIRVKLYNLGAERIRIEPGDKIIQLIIIPVFTPILVISGSLPDTERGDGGFGSTGRK